MAFHEPQWTAAEVAMLLAGISAGHTAAQIARKIGRSRNAVFAKADRLRYAAKLRGEPFRTFRRERDAKKKVRDL